MSRLASQVSWAASLSRLRAVAPTRHRKAVVDDAGDLALDPADMVEIGDHAVADIADAGRQQRQAARRHIDDLAGKLAPVRQHVAAEQMHLDPLKAPPLLGGRKNRGFLLRKRHFATRQPAIGVGRPYGRQG